MKAKTKQNTALDESLVVVVVVVVVVDDKKVETNAFRYS